MLPLSFDLHPLPFLENAFAPAKNPAPTMTASAGEGNPHRCACSLHLLHERYTVSPLLPYPCSVISPDFKAALTTLTESLLIEVGPLSPIARFQTSR
ncbi:hypothetical protein PIB30_040126 [Stylosanthes scabra]|uniref:Uncharacterized protein n=1 Tax=Stylosanthes scabra TaxID=79078 RepID=A0ABU6TE61_9FABA|nr:hypothetical protein [Stylosanthes scabra]